MKYSPSKLPEGFKRFWAAYPRKVGKGHAIKAWEKNECETIADLIVASVRKYPFSEEMDYIKYPSTWLNAWCWEDEIKEQSDEQW